jgi:hypothetical protein
VRLSSVDDDLFRGDVEIAVVVERMADRDTCMATKETIASHQMYQIIAKAKTTLMTPRNDTGAGVLRHVDRLEAGRSDA